MELTAIIISGNEQAVIADCLRSISWIPNIILVAANSSDNTIEISKNIRPDIYIIKTIDHYGKHFSKWRNIGLKKASTDWIIYIDADERITPSLKTELQKILKSNSVYSHYAIPRLNYFLGKRVQYGGTYPDYVLRLFKRSHLNKWIGYLHEKPIIRGKMSYLKNGLIHQTHRDLSSMVQKTLLWTDMEALELQKAKHPQMVGWRIFRMMFTKLFQRLVNQNMYKDGMVGYISAIFEMFDTFIIYAKLWELQNES